MVPVLVRVSSLKKLYYSLSDDDCTVILQIVALQFCKMKTLKYFLRRFYVKLWNTTDVQYLLGGQSLSNWESTLDKDECTSV